MAAWEILKLYKAQVSVEMSSFLKVPFFTDEIDVKKLERVDGCWAVYFPCPWWSTVFSAPDAAVHRPRTPVEVRERPQVAPLLQLIIRMD